MSQSKYINDSLTTRVAVLETTVQHIHETMERIENIMNAGFSEVRKEIGTVRGEMGGFRSEISSNFRWLMSLILSGIILPIVLRIFHVL